MRTSCDFRGSFGFFSSLRFVFDNVKGIGKPESKLGARKVICGWNPYTESYNSCLLTSVVNNHLGETQKVRLDSIIRSGLPATCLGLTTALLDMRVKVRMRLNVIVVNSTLLTCSGTQEVQEKENTACYEGFNFKNPPLSCYCSYPNGSTRVKPQHSLPFRFFVNQPQDSLNISLIVSIDRFIDLQQATLG